MDFKILGGKGGASFNDVSEEGENDVLESTPLQELTGPPLFPPGSWLGWVLLTQPLTESEMMLDPEGTV